MKYRISQKLELNIEDIDLYNDDKKVIPMFSICDIELNQDKVLLFEIKSS